jgi:hypothetical protein
LALKDLSVKLGLNSLGFQAGLQNAGKSLSGFKGQVNSTNSGVTAGTSALAGFAKSSMAVTAAMAAVNAGIKAAIIAFKAFVSLESSALRTADIFGESLKYVKYFAENTAKAFGMSESAAYQYAATYGNLFRAITKDSTENAKVTIAMLKASAVVASKTGRTVEDVMERIRSGLLGNTEAIEDLGIYATVGATTATAAFRQIANGRSWEQLTYYEQQQVRTLSILEQAHTRFGDTVQQSSAFSLQTLSGAFKNLISYAGAFVNAGLQPIIKGLTQLVYWATAGVKSLAALFGVDLSSALESKKNTELATSAQNGLTDAVNKTAKAKQRLAGFDQINTLAAKDDSSSGSSSGSAGGISGGVFDAVAMPELDIDTTNIGAKLDKLKTKFKTTITKIGEVLTPFNETYVKPITTRVGETVSRLWTNHILPLVPRIKSLFTSIKEMFTAFWGVFGPSIKKAASFIIGGVQNVIFFVIDAVGSVISFITDFASGIIKALTGVFKFLTGVFTGDWKKAWEGLTDILYGVAESVASVFNFIGDLITDILNFIIRALNKINFKVPDWVKDVPLISKYAGKTIGFSIEEISKNETTYSNSKGSSGRQHSHGGGAFATGGIVTSPTYALIGEAGAEAVMPLENNTGWINQLADKINARGGSGGGDIYLTEKIYLDDGTLIDTVVKRIKRDSRRINKPILGV